MGRTNSQSLEGKVCCKCRKLLIPWNDARDVKMEAHMHGAINTVKKVHKGDKQIGWFWMWDPSEGATVGFRYDFFCIDCWDPEWVKEEK